MLAWKHSLARTISWRPLVAGRSTSPCFSRIIVSGVITSRLISTDLHSTTDQTTPQITPQNQQLDSQSPSVISSPIISWRPSLVWHKEYLTKEKRLKSYYKPLLRYLGALYPPESRSQVKSLTLEIDPVLYQVGHEREYEVFVAKWADYLSSLEPSNSLSIQQFYGNNIIPTETIVLLRRISKLSNERILKFIEASINTPLVCEIIPSIVRFMCQKGGLDKAHDLLIKLSQNYAQNAHIDYHHELHNGINFGVNVLLSHYFKESHTADGVVPRWRDVYSLMKNLHPSIQIHLVSSISQHFHKRVPSFSYPQFLELFLTKLKNLHQGRMINMLSGFYRGNDQCARIIENCNFDLKTKTRLKEERAKPRSEYSDSASATPDTSEDASGISSSGLLVFNPAFYSRLLKWISRSKDNETTEKLLEYILTRADVANLQVEEMFRFLLMRSVERGDITEAGHIYDLMIQKGVTPDRPFLMTLCRAFRIQGLEARFWSVVKLLESQDGQLCGDVIVEILRMVANNYTPSMVFNYFKMIFPDSSGPVLQSLGIDQFFKHHSDEFVKPDYVPSSVPAAQDASIQWPLCALYKSILSNLHDHSTILRLYTSYRTWLLSESSHKAELFIIDQFVGALVRVGDTRSLKIAEGIFTDAVKSLKFAPLDDTYTFPVCLTHLTNSFCRIGECEKAEELVALVQDHPLFTVSSSYLTPIVKHHIVHKNFPSARDWVEYGIFYGVQFEDKLITDFMAAEEATPKLSL